MKFSNFFYNIGQGFKNIFRHGVMTTASVLVLVACMILVGTFYIIIDNIDLNFKQIKDLNMIEIMVDKSYESPQLEYIGEKLNSIKEKSHIIKKEIEYISPAQHLEIMRETYGNEEWFNDITEMNNPLRGSFRLEFENLSDTDEVRRVKYQIGAITFEDGTPAIKNEDIKDYITLYDNVMSVKNTMFIVGIWLLAILLLLSLFVIMNTIKLGVFSRRNEIKFMRLCGATKSFIRMPYIVEGMIIGIFSAALSFGLEFCLYEYLLKDIISSAAGTITGSGIILAPFSAYIPYLVIGYAAIGLFAGIISSTLSLKKYLKA